MASRILKPDVRKAMLAFDVFEKWGIDAVGPLPVTQRGKCYVLMDVDYLSAGMKQKQSSKSLAKKLKNLFMKMFVAAMVCHWSC